MWRPACLGVMRHLDRSLWPSFGVCLCVYRTVCVHIHILIVALSFFILFCQVFMPFILFRPFICLGRQRFSVRRGLKVTCTIHSTILLGTKCYQQQVRSLCGDMYLLDFPARETLYCSCFFEKDMVRFPAVLNSCKPKKQSKINLQIYVCIQLRRN